LVEGGKLRAEVPWAERLTRFSYDASLIAAFMDRWRPETHTFHFPVGEMTLSLEGAVLQWQPIKGNCNGMLVLIYLHAFSSSIGFPIWM
jgi:hypothetical protein